MSCQTASDDKKAALREAAVGSGSERERRVVAGHHPAGVARPDDVRAQLLAADAGGGLDGGAVLRRQRADSAHPLGHEALGDLQQRCGRRLAAELGDRGLKRGGLVHTQDISPANRQIQQRGCLLATNGAASLRGMRERVRRITDEDLAAAARLKALWQAMPSDARPTQQAIADHREGGGEANQSLISQYMNGRLALNYRAVLAFAKALGCRPEDIRDDLPEQRNTGTSARAPASQPVGLDVEKLTDLIETVEAAVLKSRRSLDPRTKARIIMRLYMNEQAKAASSPQEVRALLDNILDVVG